MQVHIFLKWLLAAAIVIYYSGQCFALQSQRHTRETVSKITNVPHQFCLSSHTKEIEDAFKTFDEQFHDELPRKERSACAESDDKMQGSSATRNMIDKAINETQDEDSEFNAELIGTSQFNTPKSPLQLQYLTGNLATMGIINLTAVQENRRKTVTLPSYIANIKNISNYNQNRVGFQNPFLIGAGVNKPNQGKLDYNLIPSFKSYNFSLSQHKNELPTYLISENKPNQLKELTGSSNSTQDNPFINSANYASSNKSNSKEGNALLVQPVYPKPVQVNSEQQIQPILSFLSSYKSHLEPPKQSVVKGLLSNSTNPNSWKQSEMRKQLSEPKYSSIEKKVKFISSPSQIRNQRQARSDQSENRKIKPLAPLNIDNNCPRTKVELDHISIHSDEQQSDLKNTDSPQVKFYQKETQMIPETRFKYEKNILEPNNAMNSISLTSTYAIDSALVNEHPFGYFQTNQQNQYPMINQVNVQKMQKENAVENVEPESDYKEEMPQPQNVFLKANGVSQLSALPSQTDSKCMGKTEKVKNTESNQQVSFANYKQSETKLKSNFKDNSELEKDISELRQGKLYRRSDESQPFLFSKRAEWDREWGIAGLPYRSAVPLSSPGERYNYGQALGPEIYHPESLIDMYPMEQAIQEPSDFGYSDQNRGFSHEKSKSINLFAGRDLKREATAEVAKEENELRS